MGCDTICDLPDSMLTQILLNLRTKDSVKTSVLSKRWRNLWLTVPGLHLGTLDFNFYKERKESVHVFEKFMDRFIKFNRGSRLQKLDIRYDDFDSYQHRFMELISTLVDLGIQHLHVGMNFFDRNNFMRQNIYKSKTLVSLKLHNVGLKNPEFAVSLPCLKILHLLKICYDPLFVEKLISGCPVLEDLELITPFYVLIQRVVLFLRVSSQTLKRCCIRFAVYRLDADFTVEIDAPRLEYMRLSDSQSDSVVVKNLSSLLRIDIHTKYNRLQQEYLRKPHIFCDFLTGISSLRHMIIGVRTLKVLYCYSKLRPIPIFHNLYHLQADGFFNSSVQILPALLECCPNMKNLIFDYYGSDKPEQIKFTNVSRCLMLTLENVKIKEHLMCWTKKELTMKDETWIKLVDYFLENSAVLKKLTVSFGHSCITKQVAERYKKLLTSTKLSPTCDVIIN